MKRPQGHTFELDEDDEVAELIVDHERVLAQLQHALEMGTSATVTKGFLSSIYQRMKQVSGGQTWLVLAWHDNEEQDLGIVEEERNLASALPPWSPIDAGPMLTLEAIRLDARVRSAGLGRTLLNALTQGLTRNPRLPHMVCVEKCHFPLFYVLDGYYGWLRLADVPADTPAELVYPRFFPSKTGEEVRANAVAFYAFTDLLWSTPLRVAEARVGATIPWIAPDLHPLLSRLNDALASITQTSAHVLDGLEWVLSLAPIAQALGAGYASVAEAVTDHCLALGYSDPTGATVMALSFGPSLLGRDEKVPLPLECAQLIVSYCIDHCRVLYRPIVFGCELVERLGLEEWWEKTSPWHRPHLSRIGKRWLWVPVKKPRSTTYDGKTYIPPPTCETPPLFVEEAEEQRPTKRARPNPVVSCLHCAAPVRLRGVALCPGQCAQLYYT